MGNQNPEANKHNLQKYKKIYGYTNLNSCSETNIININNFINFFSDANNATYHSNNNNINNLGNNHFQNNKNNNPNILYGYDTNKNIKKNLT